MPIPLELLKGLLPPADFDALLQQKKGDGDPLDSLLNTDAIKPRELLLVLARHWKAPFVELEHYSPDEKALQLIDEQVARRFMVLPLFQLEDKLYTALWNPEDLSTLDYLRQLTSLTIEPVLATRKDIEAGINRHFLSQERVAQTMGAFVGRKKLGQEDEKKDIRIEDTEAPAIKLVNYIISQAVNMGASDIHLEPFQDKCILRYRVDGVLHEFAPPPFNLFRSLISRIKIMSNLDVAEKRLPQDGRISTTVEGKRYDLRISIIPHLNDEGIVIRVLDTQSTGQDIENIGFTTKMMEQYKRVINRPHGILLVTGPTGSGKSTTLYSTLKAIYSPRKKIITIEDPVEYRLDGINQIQVNPAIGFTFAAGLRSILRHDPDVIMLGEIRDLESAEIAIRSSLTGHMVFSTLHTNDAPSAVIRLVDMGIPSYLVLAALSGVLAQRLVRRLCPKCKRQTSYTAKDLVFIKNREIPMDAVFFEPVGCTACNNLGYKGRLPILEFLEVTTPMRHLPSEQVTVEKIKEMAGPEGYSTLNDSLASKFFSGITSLEEVISFFSMEM